MKEYRLQNGKLVKVRLENEQEFLQKYPNATLVSGNLQSPAQDANAGQETAASNQEAGQPQNNTELNLEDGSSESAEDKSTLPPDGGFFEDLLVSAKQGFAAGQSVDEAFEVYSQGADISDENLQAYIDAAMETEALPPTREQLEFQKSQEKEGGGIWGTISALAENPGFLPQMIVSSLATMAGSFTSGKDVAGVTLASAGVGAGAGAAAGAAGFVAGPAGLVTSAGGALTGTVIGATSGLVGAMETGLTLTDLLKEELAGKEFNKENVRAILEDQDAIDRITSRSLARGLTIGAVEGLTMGLSRGVGSTMVRSGKSAMKVGATTTGTEIAGAFTGEVAGQVAAGQEVDLGEATLEAVGEIGSVTGSVSSADIIYKAIKNGPPKYKINGENRSRSEVEKLVKNPNTKVEDLAKIDIQIENDVNLKNFVEAKQKDAFNETQIDAKVSDTADRKKLVELEKKRARAKVDIDKTGIFAVPGAKENLASIEAEISEVIDKYSSVDETAKDVEARKKEAKTVRDATLQKTIKFAEEQGKLIGKETVVAENDADAQTIHDKAVEEYNANNPNNKIKGSDVAGADGFIVGDVIVINKDIAGKTGAINVGAHELLHGILAKQMKELGIEGRTKLISDFKNTITKEQFNYIDKRLKSEYKDFIAADANWINQTDEWITIFSDGIKQGNITFNEGIFMKLAQFVQNIARKFGYNKEFKSGRQVYNFLKDYQDSVEKGKLSKRALDIAGEGTSVTETAKSISDAKGPIDQLGKIDSDGQDMTEPGIGNFLYQAEADEVVRKIKEEGYLDNLIASKYKVRPVPEGFVQDVLAELTSHIKSFKPESNDSLFGWIQSQIANKAGNVYNKIYKDKGPAKTVDVDATTSEGAPIVQIEADTDIEMQRIDEIGLDDTEVQERSRLRRDIRLDENMMQTVRNAVIKTFGTKLPDVQAKDFRAALQKAFRTELKKPIQDMIGGRSEYDLFLRNHSKAIFRALPVETLVQMERNLKPEQRIFTESRRITKPTEVDKLISEGKLPKNTSRTAGPQLHTKKPFPGIDKILAYFRGTDMDELLGYKVGSSTLGTRKDKLAMSLGEELAFDATSEVLQDPAVKAKRQGILEIQGYDSKNDLVKVAEKIDRDPSVKFSKSDKKAAELKGIAELNFNKLQENLGFTIPSIFKREYYTGATGKEKFRSMMDWGRELRIGNSLSTLAEHTSEVLNTFLNNNPKFIFDFRKSTTGGQGISTFGITSVFDSMFKTAELGAKLFSRFGYSVKGKLLGENKIKTENGKKLFKVDKKWISESEFVKLQDGKLDILESLFVAIQNHLKKNPNHAWFFFRLIGDSVNNQDHMVRVSAPMKGAPIDNKGKLVHDQKIAEEHQLPQNQVGKMLLHAAVTGQSIPEVMKVIRASYAQIALLETDDVKTRQAGYSSKMPAIFWDKVVPRIIDGSLKIADGLASIVRYTASGVNLNNYTLFGMDQTITEHFGVNIDLKNKTQQQIDAIVEKQNALIDQQITGEITKQQATEQATKFSKSGATIYKEGARTRSLAMKAEANLVKYSKSGESKGMSTFDFDETLIIGGDNFVVATDLNTGQTAKILSHEWPIKGPEFAAAGWSFDFSDFANVRGGKEGPLLQKMKNQIEKYGNKNVFVLTARQQDSAKPIKEWLKSKGIDIPLRNITGLGKSEGEAKGEWMLQKFAEGYNDMYFVDDALPNVDAVKKVLDQLDIKSKVVQAKVKFSKSASQDFNKMLERSKGVDAKLEISDVDAKLRGAKRDKFRLRFFVPPSAEDLKGLMYAFVGKGEQGNKDMQWFKDNLFTPFAKGIREINSLRQKMSEEYTALKKQFPKVVQSLNDKVANTDFTIDNAIRVYLWNAAGFEVPGLSDAQNKLLVEYVAKNPMFVAYANVLSNITRTDEGYVKPKDYWIAQNIGSDLHTVAETIDRKRFLAEWQENADLVFSKENLNKIEAIYGSNFREALEDMLYRMKTGSNRPSGRTSVENKFLNWVNGAVSAVMFFNMRSAALQGLSMVNFLNFEDNNVFKASKAFANQKQFWSDFAYLFNSDMLKQRRAGLKIDVSASELTDAFAQGKNKTEAVIKYMLEKGFIPTKMMDSFAIAIGGSTFYRNRVNKLMKEGMSKSEAENQAFLDFQEIAEETQQSSRPDLISMQQASSLGRLILAWANTPMQYTRLTKKALSDIINGRGDTKANVSRILYYGAVQNIIFGTLQTGLAFLMFGDDEEDKSRDKKEQRVLNGMLDTLLRGVGVYGALVSTAKNALIAAHEELGKGFGRKDYSKIMQQLINLSPPIGSKVRKIIGAVKSYDFNKDIINQMDHGINNPAWNVFTGVVEGVTNAPLDRIRAKMVNVREAFVGDHEMWQRVALAMGWNKWDLGVKDIDIEEARQKAKEEKKSKKKQETKKKEQQTETKKVRCRAITSSGKRCKNKTDNKNKKCYAHQ